MTTMMSDDDDKVIVNSFVFAFFFSKCFFTCVKKLIQSAINTKVPSQLISNSLLPKKVKKD